MPVTRIVGDHHTRKQIDEIVNNIIPNLVPDLKIISGENEEIQSNKYLLSLFSPGLAPLLSSSCCSPTTFFFPDFSTFSINDIINIINNGFILNDNLSWEDSLEIKEIGKLLFVENMILIEDGKFLNEKQIEDKMVPTNSIAASDIDCLLYTSDAADE